MLRWTRLETAKRRLLLQLELLNLPPFCENCHTTHPLGFRFLEDTVGAGGETVPVLTGHAEGIITINLVEADSVHREQSRVAFGEPHRTLIGHMRHEIGHYIDWAFAGSTDRERYNTLFGDPSATDYQESLDKYYASGPTDGWEDSYVSAYATMHPWEDFAETVNAYLDIMAIGTTANDQGRADLDLSPASRLHSIVPEILAIATEVSEYNFDLGLLPLLPERLPPPVIAKLAYVHSLRERPTLSLSSTTKTESGSEPNGDC